eukprot:7839233-Prorocentrum_lima.AAC.1
MHVYYGLPKQRRSMQLARYHAALTARRPLQDKHAETRATGRTLPRAGVVRVGHMHVLSFRLQS